MATAARRHSERVEYVFFCLFFLFPATSGGKDRSAFLLDYSGGVDALLLTNPPAGESILCVRSSGTIPQKNRSRMKKNRIKRGCGVCCSNCSSRRAHMYSLNPTWRARYYFPGDYNTLLCVQIILYFFPAPPPLRVCMLYVKNDANNISQRSFSLNSSSSSRVLLTWIDRWVRLVGGFKIIYDTIGSNLFALFSSAVKRGH